jgi:hypothetical protein
VRRRAREQLHLVAGDVEAIEDADLACPLPQHDLGRKPSRPPRQQPKHGQRRGFKVWKTPFWKRRRKLRAARNALERSLTAEE